MNACAHPSQNSVYVKVKQPTIVKIDPKAPFSIAATPRC